MLSICGATAWDTFATENRRPICRPGVILDSIFTEGIVCHYLCFFGATDLWVVNCDEFFIDKCVTKSAFPNVKRIYLLPQPTIFTVLHLFARFENGSVTLYLSEDDDTKTKTTPTCVFMPHNQLRDMMQEHKIWMDATEIADCGVVVAMARNNPSLLARSEITSVRLMRSLYDSLRHRCEFHPDFICERNIIESIYPSCPDSDDAISAIASISASRGQYLTFDPCSAKTHTHSTLDIAVAHGNLAQIKKYLRAGSNFYCLEWQSSLIQSFVFELLMEEVKTMCDCHLSADCSNIIMAYAHHLADLSQFLQLQACASCATCVLL
jgi:hypothetical protein